LASTGAFFRQTKFQQHLDRLAEDVRLRRTFESAGFRLRKIEREKLRFELVTSWAQRLVEDETRAEKVIRRDILAGFRSEGLPLRNRFLVVRYAGRHVVTTASLLGEQTRASSGLAELADGWRSVADMHQKAPSYSIITRLNGCRAGHLEYGPARLFQKLLNLRPGEYFVSDGT
jgi:hypothetical protein